MSEMDAGEKRYSVAEKPLPVVMMFQPTEFEFVGGDRLGDWEEAVRERVLGGVARVKGPEALGVGTWSGCPTFDECDQLN